MELAPSESGQANVQSNNYWSGTSFPPNTNNGNQNYKNNNMYALAVRPGRMIALDLSLENLYRQYTRCRRNKRNTVNALRFEAEQEKNLLDLREALLQRTYRPVVLSASLQPAPNCVKSSRLTSATGSAPCAGGLSGTHLGTHFHPRLLRLPQRQGRAWRR